MFERHVLTPEEFGNPDYVATARALGISEKDVSNHLYLAKKRFRKLLRKIAGTTVKDEEDIDRELAELRQYF